MQNPKYDMTTYTFTQSNNITLPSTTGGYANEFTIRLPYPINLLNAKLTLKDIFCYNAFTNVRNIWGNNKLAYIVPNQLNADYSNTPTSWQRYEISNKPGLNYIEDGIYDIDLLNKLLKYNFEKNGHYWTDKQGKRHYPIELSFNSSSYRTHFVFNRLQGELPSGWTYPSTGQKPFVSSNASTNTQINVANTWVWLELPASPYLAGTPSTGISSMKRILGYNNPIIPNVNVNNTTTMSYTLLDDQIRIDGDFIPTAVEQNVIQLSCNLVNNPLISSTQGSVIHSFSPNVKPGSLIIEQPFSNFVPITDGLYNEIKIRLVDTFGRPMPLIDDGFTCTIVIHRPVEDTKSEAYKRSRLS